jgi:hypothetical protein
MLCPPSSPNLRRDEGLEYYTILAPLPLCPFALLATLSGRLCITWHTACAPSMDHAVCRCSPWPSEYLHPSTHIRSCWQGAGGLRCSPHAVLLPGTRLGRCEIAFPCISQGIRAMKASTNTRPSLLQTERLSKRQQMKFGPSPAQYWRQAPPSLGQQLKKGNIGMNQSPSRKETPILRLLHTASYIWPYPEPAAPQGAWSCGELMRRAQSGYY